MFFFFDQTKFKVFTAAEKNFIVKTFGRNPSPTKVRHYFLKQYGVKIGSPMAKYKLKQFIRVNLEFEKRGSVGQKIKKKRKAPKGPLQRRQKRKNSS